METISDYRQVIETNKDRIIATHRWWNNSMYHYEDSIVVWNFDKSEAETVHLGIDTFDAIRFTVDVNTDAFKAYIKHRDKMLRQLKHKEFRRKALEYSHHGLMTAGRIVKFLDTVGENARYHTLHKLLTVKNFRSKFRHSLCSQVLAWIKTPARLRKYSFPLSQKQFDSIAGRW